MNTGRMLLTVSFKTISKSSGLMWNQICASWIIYAAEDTVSSIAAARWDANKLFSNLLCRILAP